MRSSGRCWIAELLAGGTAVERGALFRLLGHAKISVRNALPPEPKA